MRNASDHQGENNRLLAAVIKHITRTFLDVSRCSLAKHRKEMYKEVCCTCKVVFC